MTKVNAGPLEYVNVFLKAKAAHPVKHVERLKEIYRFIVVQFCQLCTLTWVI